MQKDRDKIDGEIKNRGDAAGVVVGRQESLIIIEGK